MTAIPDITSLSRYNSRNDSLPPGSSASTLVGFQEAASCTHLLRTLCRNAIQYYLVSFCAGNAPSCGGVGVSLDKINNLLTQFPPEHTLFIPRHWRHIVLTPFTDSKAVWRAT